MRKIIRLTESDLHRIIRDSVSRILAEDGESSLNADGSGDASFGIAYPAFGKGTTLKQKSPVGDKVSDGMTPVDMEPALRRGDSEKNGSISMNRVSSKKK